MLSIYQCMLSAVLYQRGHQNPYIEEEQTTQWPQDLKLLCLSQLCGLKDRLIKVGI